VVWGLDKDGKFISTSKQSLMSKICIAMKMKANVENVFKIVLSDIGKVRTTVDLQLEICAYLSDKEKGRLLMRLFQSDLLPGISGKILESKGARDVKVVNNIIILLI